MIFSTLGFLYLASYLAYATHMENDIKLAVQLLERK